MKMNRQPDRRGHFGPFGGRYAAETLMPALYELEAAYREAQRDAQFRREFRMLQKDYGGRETPLYFASRLTDSLGGARIYLKREDLNHTGSHKINNTLGQALLARRMGKRKVIAETGAGQHGVATATVAALSAWRPRLHAEVGYPPAAAQRLPHEILGAEVVPVASGTATLRTPERSLAVLDRLRPGHLLRLRHDGGAPSLPDEVRDFQSRHRPRSEKAILERKGGCDVLVLRREGAMPWACFIRFAMIPV